MALPTGLKVAARDEDRDLKHASKRKNWRRRRLGRAVTIALLAGVSIAGLAGCGFEPLNAKRTTASSTVQQMSDVKIALIQASADQEYSALQNRIDLARVGQQLRNELLNSFNPDGAPSQPRYEMHVDVSETETQLAVDSAGLSLRSNITVIAKYRLVNVSDGKPVLSGTSSFVNGYAIVTNSYSTVVGRKDAENRALRGVAEDITRRTALYFERQQASEN